MFSDTSKIYLKNTVFEESLDRIRYLFDEFPNVVVGISGGKDSTVVFNLAMMVAEEKGRLPLKVMFLDQEAEWECVINHVREIMTDPRVEPMWFQMPFKLFNATSSNKQWLQCWEEGADWLREKESFAVTENKYGTDRFADLFTNIVGTEFPDTKTCYLTGVRAEESNARLITLTGAVTYKYITWGKILNKRKEHYTFHPLYDWSLSDIWKAISNNSWSYTKLYDYMYQYGIPATKMRVSNVHHETALQSLYYLQEIEPEMWNKLTDRLEGIATTGQLCADAFEVPKKLPYMFKDWCEYRDYLLNHLISDENAKSKLKKRFEDMDKIYTHEPIKTRAGRLGARAVLRGDFEMTIINNFLKEPEAMVYRMWKEGHTGPFKRDIYIPKDEHNNYLKP